MGGMGSTRWSGHESRQLVEQTLQLKVSQLKSALARLAIDHHVSVILSWPGFDLESELYRRSDSECELDLTGQLLFLVSDPAPIAGARWRFSCIGCGQKRDALFTRTPTLGDVWRAACASAGFGSADDRPVMEWKCRQCAGLGYEIENLDGLQRGLRRARSMWRKMGGVDLEWHVDAPPPRRPAGMHRVKYNALRSEYIRAVEEYDGLWSKLFSKDAALLLGKTRTASKRFG